MTSQQILTADFLDILFEGRNKTYGAYALRRYYPAQLLKAIGITALLVLLLLFIGLPSSNKTTGIDTKPEVVVTSVALDTKKPELPKPKVEQRAAPAQQIKQALFVDNMKVVEAAKPIATQDELSKVAIGSSTIDGPVGTGIQPPPITPPGSGAGTTAEPEKVEPPLPNRQPQFPGGNAAWLSWLNRYLMPPADLEPGEKRSVLVKFWVDEEGAISNFQVVQSGGADFDNEVIRALKRMPRWLPAIQAGKPVAVSFTQPVTFQGE